MKKMKRIVVFIGLGSAVLAQVNAQIGGLSASKLATINPDVVAARKIEFEPSFYIYRSVSTWSDSGKRIEKFITRDSAEYSSSVQMRFTYGLLDRAEIGASIPPDLSGISLGAKFSVLNANKTRLALMAGLNLNKTSGRIAKNSVNPEYANAYVGGLTGSFDIGEKLSTDFDLQYQGYMDKKLNKNTDLFADADIGYYVVENFQLITGFNYIYSKSNDPASAQTLIFNPGFTDGQAKNFILVISFPVTIYGKNSESFAGVTFALTIMLE